MEARGYDFRDLIGDLTELLVGRKEQLEQAKKWLREHQETGGILWIGGKPGVGKSAFMAELAKRFKGDAKLCVVPFFFRSGDARCSPDQFYHAAILRLLETFNLQVQLDAREPRQVQFMKVLEAAREKQSQESQTSTVLFLLDGLDEVASQHPDFARLPLSHQHPRLIWFCAGRGEPPLNEIFAAEGVERLWENGELPPLAERDVRELIEQECGRQRYQLFERDEQTDEGVYRNHFIEELVKRSEGLPLYVRLVIEDLKAGRLTFRDEDKLPEGLRDYFERILERLKMGDIPRYLTETMALLCWAYEPLTEEILHMVLKPMHPYANDLKSSLTKALRYGHVMLRRAETSDGILGWTCYHESFRQHLRQTPTIADTRDEAHAALLDWCSHWQEHKNPYALRHYAEHLRTAQRYDELYVLVRSDAFLQAQAGALTEEPDAPLHTLQAALEGAKAQDDAAKMAEFSLTHARRLTEITQESPLDALRAGNLERALALADLFEIERCVLWHLLLAWELKDTCRLEEAQATLQRLLKKDLPRLAGWQGNYAACLLRYVPDVSGDALHPLQKQLLGDEDRYTLCKGLANGGHFPEALETAQGIGEELGRAEALTAIAAAQAQVGEFAAALETARRITTEQNREEVLRNIAVAQTEAGKFSAALETAQEILQNRRGGRCYAILRRRRHRQGKGDQREQPLPPPLSSFKGLRGQWAKLQ